jgi:hypothetical protein
VVLGVLLAATVAAAFEYHRQLRRTKKEYEVAKGAVDDIMLSFNRQIKHEAAKLEAVAYRIESIASKSDGTANKAESLEGIIRGLEGRIVAESEARAELAARLEGVEKKASDIVLSHGDILSKLIGLEEQSKQLRTVPELGLEAVIPIKREKAMAQLTETELAVLELLVAEGAKTAPDIKERVKLSREHTARLMKKLYEEGYLERDTGKIPFKYSAKTEMAKLLGKVKSGSV